MRGWRMVAVAALVAGAAPAGAASVTELGAKGTAAYERGATSGVTPVTLGEQTMCALYWNQWYGAVDSFFISDELLAALPLAVDSDAFAAMEAWTDLAMDGYQERDGNVDAFMTAANRDRPAIADRIRAAAGGDFKAMEGLMEMLGSCQKP